MRRPLNHEAICRCPWLQASWQAGPTLTYNASSALRCTSHFTSKASPTRADFLSAVSIMRESRRASTPFIGSSITCPCSRVMARMGGCSHAAVASMATLSEGTICLSTNSRISGGNVMSSTI